MVLRNNSFSFLSLFIKEVGDTVPLRAGCVDMWRNKERRAEKSVAGVGGMVGKAGSAAAGGGTSAAAEPRGTVFCWGDRGLAAVIARGAEIGGFSEERSED